MAYEFNRNRRDAAFETSKATADGSSTPQYSSSFDLGQVTGGDIEKVVAELVCPFHSDSQLANTKVLTYELQDSADDSSFASLDPAIATTQTGATTTGAPAKTVRFRLPPGCRRYIRIKQTNTASPGTLAQTYYFRLLF